MAKVANKLSSSGFMMDLVWCAFAFFKATLGVYSLRFYSINSLILPTVSKGACFQLASGGRASSPDTSAPGGILAFANAYGPFIAGGGSVNGKSHGSVDA